MKFFALGLLLSTNVMATEMTRQEFDAHKSGSDFCGIVTQAVDQIMKLNEEEKKVEPYGHKHQRIEQAKEQFQNNIWRACLAASEDEKAECGIVECTRRKMLLDLKIKDGWSTKQQTIELTKD